MSPTTIGSWLAGRQFPQDIDKVLAVVRAIAASAAYRGAGSAEVLDLDRWREAHQNEARRRASVVSAAVQQSQAARTLAVPAAGWLLAEVIDPFVLEVHRPMQPDGP